MIESRSACNDASPGTATLVMSEGDTWLTGGPAGPGSLREAASPPLLTAYEDRLHEIRSSLAALAVAVHVLTSDEVPEAVPRQRVGNLLRQEVERLQRLVAASASPPDDGDPQDLDLDEIIETVVLCRRLAGQMVTWHPTGHRILGPRDEVLEILNILLVNAARHAPGSPAHVDVEGEDGVIRLSVRDEGPGIAPELRTAIFDRGTRSRTTGGTGIGLSLARALARGLGGTLALKQDGGPGAKFEMTLPQFQLGGAA
jgi:signal transduction histidine kinase